MPPLTRPLNTRNICQAEEQNLYNVDAAKQSTLKDPEVLALPEHQQEVIKDSFEIAQESSKKVLVKCYTDSNIIFLPTLDIRSMRLKGLQYELVERLQFDPHKYTKQSLPTKFSSDKFGSIERYREIIQDLIPLNPSQSK